jgi:phage gp29-like protein
MAKRFKTSPVPTGEISSYISNPYALSSIYMFGSSSPFTGTGSSIVRPNDDLLIQKGGNRALSTYQRLLLDEQVQGSYSKLLQEVTSRPWYVQEYSDKPGDLAVRDFVAEVLEELPIDDIFKGLAEALIVGFSVAEVMWKKTKRGVIPFDVRVRDQRRFVFQEAEDSQTGFTMRCLTFNRMFEGIELPARKFIINRYWTQHNGDPYGSSIGRILYPLVKFRRRALESYVLYGDRYATPTTVATAPLSASTAEIDNIYGMISNLSQETAMVLPDGFELDFINPEGSPDVFKGLIDYLDKVISLLICGENEAGQAESGSRASSMVANVVRVVRASEISEMICHQLTQTLVRWIVDLNFGADVASPTLTREFRIEESQLTPADVSLLIQNGFKPRREWIERHFRVDLEDEAKSAEGQQGSEGETTFDPEKDKNLYESIFGPEDGSGGDAEGAPAEMTPDEVAPDEGAPDEGIQGEETPDDTTPTEETLDEEAPAEMTPTEETPDDTTPNEETPTKQPPVEKQPKKKNSKANKELDSLLSELDSALAEEPGESEPGELPEEGSNETESTSGISDGELDSIISEMENKVKGKK